MPQNTLDKFITKLVDSLANKLKTRMDSYLKTYSNYYYAWSGEDLLKISDSLYQLISEDQELCNLLREYQNRVEIDFEKYTDLHRS